MLRDRVGLSVVGWGGGKVGHVIHSTNPYPIINSPDHHQFLPWGTSRSAKMASQFLRNLIFTPLTIVHGQCSPKHK